MNNDLNLDTFVPGADKMSHKQKFVILFAVVLLIFVTRHGIFQDSFHGTSIQTSIASIRQLSYMAKHETAEYLRQSTEDFDRAQKRVSRIKFTEFYNNGILYDINPKEILHDSRENVKANEKAPNGTQTNNTGFPSISVRNKISSKYPYNPFRTRTFGAEELENEKFTGVASCFITGENDVVFKNLKT